MNRKFGFAVLAAVLMIGNGAIAQNKVEGNEKTDQMAAVDAKIAALQVSVARLDALLEKMEGWDCAAVCQVKKTYNGAPMILEEITVASHGMNATEALEAMSEQCSNAASKNRYARSFGLLNSAGQPAGIEVCTATRAGN